MPIAARILVVGASLALAGCWAGGPDRKPPTDAEAPSGRPTGSSSAPLPASSAAPSAAPEECRLRRKPLDFVAWSRSGGVLLTGGPTSVEAAGAGGKTVEEGSMDAWDLVKGERTFTFHLGASKTRRHVHLAFTGDGSAVVATGSAHDTPSPIARWDLRTGATTFASAWITYPEGVDVSHDGTKAIVDGGGSNAVLLELPSLKVLVANANATSASGAMAFSKGDASIVDDQQLAVSLAAPTTLKTTKSWSGASALSPDRAVLAVAGKDLWGLVDAGSGKKLRAFEGPPKNEEATSAVLTFSPDGKRVAAVVQERLLVWSAETGKKLGAERLDAGSSGGGGAMWTSDSSLVVVGRRAFDAATGKWASAEELPEGPSFPLAGHEVAVLEGERLRSFDAATAKPTGRSWAVPGGGAYEDPARGASFDTSFSMSPDGAHFAYPRTDAGTVRVVRLSDGASVDLGVVWVGEVQKGYVVAADGAFEGPVEAGPCAAKGIGKATTPSTGVLRRFVASASGVK